MQRAGNISNMAVMSRALKLEGYILDVNTVSKMDDEEFQEFAKRGQALMKTDLSTHVAKKFPLGEFKDAMAFYDQNQTAGKVLLQPSLTKSVHIGAPPVPVANVGSNILNKRISLNVNMMKLYVMNIHSCVSYSARMVAEYCGLPVQLVIVDPEMEKTKEIKEKKKYGGYPFLETSDGVIIN